MRALRLTIALLLLNLAGTSRAGSAASPLVVVHSSLSGHPSWQSYDLTVDLKHYKLQTLRQPGGDHLQDLVQRAGPGVIAAINGGYFTATYLPVSWLRDAGVDYAQKKKPYDKGGVLAIRGTQVYVGKLPRLPFVPDFAVQNGPLILDEGGQIGIHRDDQKHAARTIACVKPLGKTAADADRALHFILLRGALADGPTLMQTATLLAQPEAQGGFGCSTALNLDGGPSTGVWFAPSVGEESALPPVPIGYGIGIVGKG